MQFDCIDAKRMPLRNHLQVQELFLSCVFQISRQKSLNLKLKTSNHEIKKDS